MTLNNYYNNNKLLYHILYIPTIITRLGGISIAITKYS